jgi:hypothetical protein
MRRVLSKRGTEYKNEIIDELFKLLKIEYTFSTAHHHQTLGEIERTLLANNFATTRNKKYRESSYSFHIKRQMPLLFFLMAKKVCLFAAPMAVFLRTKVHRNSSGKKNHRITAKRQSFLAMRKKSKGI